MIYRSSTFVKQVPYDNKHSNRYPDPVPAYPKNQPLKGPDPKKKYRFNTESHPNHQLSSAEYPAPKLDLTHLQHVQQGGFAGVIQTQEKELGVLVKKAKRSQNIVNYDQKAYQ